MKISKRGLGLVFLLISILIYAFPALFSAVTGHGILSTAIENSKFAIILISFLIFTGSSFFILAIYFFVFGKSKEGVDSNLEFSENEISGKRNKKSGYFLLYEIIFFILLFIIASFAELTELFVVIFLIVYYVAPILGILGIFIAIKNFKKTSVFISLLLISVSLVYISGYSFNLASNIQREISGEARRDKEALIEHELRNIESNQNQVDYMGVQSDLDVVMREWYKKYQEYFSEAKVYSRYIYDGLGDKNKFGPYIRPYGVELVDLACPKCYTEEWGEFKEKKNLYDAYVSILDPLLNKPIQVTLPEYKYFKEDMGQLIKDLLDQKGFFVRGINSYGMPIVLPEHEQPLSYYMDPFQLLPDVGFGVPVIIHYQDRNINEELMLAAKSL